MIPLIVLGLGVLTFFLLSVLYWRWQLRGLLLGGVVIIAAIFAYASGLALVYTDIDTTPKAISRFDFFIGALVGIVFFVGGALMTVLALETRRAPNRTLREIFNRTFSSKRGRGAEWQVLNGTLQQTRVADLGVTEPGRIIIGKDYAVIFEESSGRFTRAAFGPTEVPERPNDKPKIVIATRPRFKRFSISDLFTADGLVIDRADFSMLYRLKEDPNLAGTPNIRQPISEETLLKAVYAIPQIDDGKQTGAETWQTAVEEKAKDVVRIEFEKILLLKWFQRDQSSTSEVKSEDGVEVKNTGKAGPLQDLTTDIFKSMNASIKDWGAVVETLQIDRIALPQQVQKFLQDQGENERIKNIERAKGEAWSDLVKQMSKSLGGDRALALKYISIFEYLDSLARAAHSASPTMGASIRDLLNLARDSNQKQGPGSGPKQSPDSGKGPRDWVDETKEPKKPTVIGDGPEESSPSGEEGRSGEAVS